MFLKIVQYLRETPVLESLFNTVAGHQAFNFIRKRLQHRYFPVNIAKLYKSSFFIEQPRWRLLFEGEGAIQEYCICDPKDYVNRRLYDFKSMARICNFTLKIICLLCFPQLLQRSYILEHLITAAFAC